MSKEGKWKMVLKANGSVDYVEIDDDEYAKMYTTDNRNSEKQEKKLHDRIEEGVISEDSRNCFTCKHGEKRTNCRIRCTLFDLILTPFHHCANWSKIK